MGQVSPNHLDVRRGRRGYNSLFYLSGDVVGYCGTSIRRYLNLVYIVTGDLHHLSEVLTGCKCDVYPSAYGRHININ